MFYKNYFSPWFLILQYLPVIECDLGSITCNVEPAFETVTVFSRVQLSSDIAVSRSTIAPIAAWISSSTDPSCTSLTIFKCNELKETYANENGFQYDYVIRLRFDLIVYHPIICRQLNPNYIYYLEMGQTDKLISDWLNIGSNSIMNIYSSMYFSMDYINNFRFFKKNERQVNTLEPSEICGGAYEYMIRDLMYLHKIPIMGIRTQFKLVK